MPNNHNIQPTIQSEIAPEARALFDIDKVNEWRTRQFGILNGLRERSFNTAGSQYVIEFQTSIDSTLDDFLAEQGVDSNAASYQEVRDLYRSASIDRVDENEWGNSPASRGVDPDDHRSQSDVFKEKIAARVGDIPDASAIDQEREARDAEFESLEVELGEARENLAAIAAKRQGRLFTLDYTKYDKLQDDYFAKVQALGKRHLQEHSEYSEEDKSLIATTILFDEQEKLRELTISKLENTKVSKIIAWMNKGSKWQRIGKGVAVGATAGVAGSFLAGAVGAGIVAGGVVAATRFARGFSLKDNDRRMSSYADTVDIDAGDITAAAALDFASDEDRMDKTSRLMKDQKDFDDGIRHEQSKRRKSAAWGLGSIAIGAVAGAGLHEGMEHLKGEKLTAWDWAKERFDTGGSEAGGRPPGIPSAEDVDGDGIKNGLDGDYSPEDGGIPDAGLGDSNTPSGVEPSSRSGGGVSWADFSPSARTITSGEGWYQTFQEMGIPKEHWADVLQDAGPKLQEQGWAYFDQANGEWRISHTGQLSDSALKVIASASKRDGFTLAA